MNTESWAGALNPRKLTRPFMRLGRANTVRAAIGVAVLSTLVLACSPDLRGTICDDESDCTFAEVCVNGVCVSIADDVSVDTEEDVPTDGPESDTNTDVGDVSPDEDTDDVTPDGDTGDLDHDPPIDDLVCDGLVWLRALDVQLYEPCRFPSPFFPDGCESGNEYALPLGEASQNRIDEPVEFPLVNGLLDDFVVAYWQLDGELLDAGPHAHNLSQTDADDLSFAAGGIGIGSRAFLPLESGGLQSEPGILAGPGSWSAMFWAVAASNIQDPSRFTLLSRVTDDETPEVYVGLENVDEQPELVVRIAFDNATSFETRVRVDIGDVGEGANFHVALVAPEYENPSLFLNGERVVASWTPDAENIGLLAEGVWRVGSLAENDDRFDGAIDEVMLFSRPLAYDEIVRYVELGRTWGAESLPFAQPDFDDVRVMDSSDPVAYEIVGPHPASDTNPGRIAHWQLDTGQIRDLVSGTDSVVSPLVTPRFGRYGDRDGALDFRGDGGVITEFVPPFEAASEFTIEFWMLVPDGGGGVALGLSTGDGDLFSIGVQSETGFLELGHHVAGTFTVDEFTDLRDGNWHHVAFLRARQDLEYFSVWLDGQRVVTVPDSTDVELTQPMAIGGLAGLENSITDHWTGVLDDIVVHNTALVPEELRRRSYPRTPTLRWLASTSAGPSHWPTYRIQWTNEAAQAERLMVDNPTGGPACYGLLSSCNGYVGWWRFDEATGVSVIDRSAEGAHLELHFDLDEPVDPPARAAGIGGGQSLAFFNGAQGATLTTAELPSEAFTAEMWVWLDEAQEQDFLTAWDSEATCTGFRISLDDGNHPYFQTSDATCGAESTFSDPDVESVELFSLTWHQLVVQHDLDGEDTTLLVDGGDVNANWDDGGPPETQRNGVTLSLGTPDTFGRSTPGFVGAFDEIRLSNRRLSDDELLRYPAARLQVGAVIECPE